MTLEEYLDAAIKTYKDDPASDEFERGYLAALIEIGEVLIPGFEVSPDIRAQLS